MIGAAILILNIFERVAAAASAAQHTLRSLGGRAQLGFKIRFAENELNACYLFFLWKDKPHEHHDISTPFLAAGITLASAFTAHAQVLYVANSTAGTIETYNATTVALINNSFVSGLSANDVNGVTEDAGTNTLYVADYILGIKAYNATTGAPHCRVHSHFKSRHQLHRPRRDPRARDRLARRPRRLGGGIWLPQAPQGGLSEGEVSQPRALVVADPLCRGVLAAKPPK